MPNDAQANGADNGDSDLDTKTKLGISYKGSLGATLNVRVPDDMDSIISDIAKIKKVNRSDVIRWLLVRGIRSLGFGQVEYNLWKKVVERDRLAMEHASSSSDSDAA